MPESASGHRKIAGVAAHQVTSSFYSQELRRPPFDLVYGRAGAKSAARGRGVDAVFLNRADRRGNQLRVPLKTQIAGPGKVKVAAAAEPGLASGRGFHQPGSLRCVQKWVLRGAAVVDGGRPSNGPLLAILCGSSFRGWNPQRSSGRCTKLLQKMTLTSIGGMGKLGAELGWRGQSEDESFGENVVIEMLTQCGGVTITAPRLIAAQQHTALCGRESERCTFRERAKKVPNWPGTLRRRRRPCRWGCHATVIYFSTRTQS